MLTMPNRSLYCCTSILLQGVCLPICVAQFPAPSTCTSLITTPVYMYFYCCSWFSSSVIPNNVMNLYNLLLVVAFAVVVLPFLTIRDHGLPTYLCCASTIAFPLSNPKCVAHLPTSICLYITYKHTMNMYFYCCPCTCPTINMVLC